MTARLADYAASAAWTGFIGLFIGLMLVLVASISAEQHAWDAGIHTYQGRVYDGSVLIGVCGGQPPAVMPQSSDPTVDVTWYPECPR